MIGSSFFGSKRDPILDIGAHSTSDTEGSHFDTVASPAADARVNDRMNE